MYSQFKPIHISELKTYLDNNYPVIYVYHDEEISRELKEEYPNYSFIKSKDFGNIVIAYKID